MITHSKMVANAAEANARGVPIEVIEKEEAEKEAAAAEAKKNKK